MATTEILEREILAVEDEQLTTLVENEAGSVTLVEAPTQVTIVESPEPVMPDGITEELTLIIQEAAPITLVEEADEVTILNAEQRIELTTTETQVVIEEAAVGPQGIPGPPGPNSVFVQPTNPGPQGRPYFWVQTGLGDGTNFEVWFDDGAA